MDKWGFLAVVAFCAWALVAQPQQPRPGTIDLQQLREACGPRYTIRVKQDGYVVKGASCYRSVAFSRSWRNW